MNYVLCILLAYLIGSINPSYIIGRLKGIDIRKTGSGNAGGSNALIVMGKVFGLAVILFDIFKAYFAIDLCIRVFPEVKWAFSISAASCTIGHIFPFYMGFRGGKGLACLGGTLIAYSPKLFLLLFVTELILVLIVDYICIAPITCSIAFPVIYAVLEHDYIGMGILFIPAAIMIMKHRENFKRIREGKELHMSYLWKKKDELKRLGHHFPEDENKLSSGK